MGRPFGRVDKSECNRHFLLAFPEYTIVGVKMFRTKPIKTILLAMGLILIAGSCAINTQQSNRQQMAYDNCMKERIEEFSDISISEAKMTAHFICNMETGYMDDRYFDCLPITKNMLVIDGISDENASAGKVCKYYAQACKENPKHTACRKHYIKDEYLRNPNAPYPGTRIKKKKFGSTLLIELVASGDVETAEAVIKRGANVNESKGANWTPLVEARSKDDQAMIQMLLRYGAK